MRRRGVEMIVDGSGACEAMTRAGVGGEERCEERKKREEGELEEEEEEEEGEEEEGGGLMAERSAWKGVEEVDGTTLVRPSNGML